MSNSPLENALLAYQTGWSLPQDFYLKSEIFDVEIEKIWSKYWLFAGLEAQIPESGDYFTYKIQHNSIVIIRGNKGEIYAHHNTCRHRGSLICLENEGNTPALMCPYHQWVYDKSGKLLKARLMPDDFDKSAHDLEPVAVQVVEGLIYISLSKNPPSFEKLRADFSNFLAPFDLNKAKIGHRTTYQLKTNWKLVTENFRECYHCGPAHPEYCSAVVGANLRESANEETSTKQAIWQAKGFATETVPFVGDSFHFAVRYPLRPGVKSYSLDGEAVSKPIAKHTDYDAGVVGLVSYPNFWIDAVADYVWVMKTTPLSPSKTQIDIFWLVDANAIEGLDYTIDRLTEFWKITAGQDWELCENNFAGICSPVYRPGPLAPAEQEVTDFLEWYVRRLKD
jgi:phenylpropionate dioxygenase-like ring-hydroxylating dioxygenase large terminal subunit